MGGKGKDVQKLWVKAESEGRLVPGAWGEKAACQRSPGLVSDTLLAWHPLLFNFKDPSWT